MKPGDLVRLRRDIWIVGGWTGIGIVLRIERQRDVENGETWNEAEVLVGGERAWFTMGCFEGHECDDGPAVILTGGS
jgi:hypothetical protein